MTIKIEADLAVKPFNTINCYEYKDNNPTYLEKSNKPISFSKIGNQSILSASFIIRKEYTNYIAVNIKPLININNIIAQIHLYGDSYDLNKGTSINITNLISLSPYTFYINVQRLDVVTIYFTMNYMATKPFIKIDTFEAESKNYPIINSTSHPISFLNRDNQLKVNFSLQIYFYATHIIWFKITPNYDIDFMHIKFDIENVYMI